MTRQRDFKALVRERMAKTGERYTTARTHLIAKSDRRYQSSRTFPGVLGGYDRFGGIQSGTSAIHNVLRHAGFTWPPAAVTPSETTINGLCGGPGFLYAVFEYKGWPPMLTLALGSRSMPDVYAAEGLSRLGVRLRQHETTGRAAAQKALDETLSAGRAALCVTDIASLPWYGLAISDRRVELGDTSGNGVSAESAELWRQRHTLAQDSRLSADAALRLYADIASLVARIIDAERAAVELMAKKQ